MTPNELVGTSSIGIYQIAREMAEIVALAETAETPEEIAACEQQLQLYVTMAEISKVDNVARAIKHLSANVGTDSNPGLIDREIARLKERKATQARILTFLKSTVQSIMEAGVKDKLTSGTNTIRLQGNSQPSVIIDDPSRVPDSFLRATVTLSLELWKKLCASYGLDPQDVKVETEFMRSRISEAIQQGRDVPGVRLEKGRHIRVG